jgi:hypothetical protein
MFDPLAAVVVALVVVAAAGWIARTVKRIPEDQRLLVERLGMFNRICGPGWQLLLPWIERGVVLRLDERVPGWGAFKEEPLRQKLRKEYYEQLNRGAPDAGRQ